MSRYRLGVDIGGTFTDFAALNESDGRVQILKVPTTPRDPAEAVVDGVRVLAERFHIHPADIVYFVHGTTLAVNTLIQRSGETVGLLATRGFEDILEIRRLRLPEPQNFFTSPPAPLVPRHLVGGVDERMTAAGRVERPVDLRHADAEARRLVLNRCGAIAICFLHAYVNDAHERAVKESVQRAFPDIYVCTSAEVWPQRREYERALLATINAHIGPRMRRYFQTLETDLRGLGLDASILSTKSNGGVMTARTASERPVETLFSGPASGVIGAHWVAAQAGVPKVITFDLGGTSADVSVVTEGPTYSFEAEAGDFPILMPAVDVRSVGAGGGSIAWVDRAGVLKVGPRSAGSEPGPACYARGGNDPTVTDAYLTLGWINPERFAGGAVRLDPGPAESALRRIAKPLGLGVVETAWAILQVATANMSARFVPFLAGRGVNAQEYAMVAYGGAGPTHGFLLAEEIGLSRLIVPTTPGALCALGCLVADMRADFIRVFDARCDRIDPGRLDGAFGRLESEARSWLAAEAISVDAYRLERSADMRYVGQSFDVTTPLPNQPVESLSPVVEAFYDAYRPIYGYVDREAPVEMVNLRVQVVGETPKPQAAVQRTSRAKSGPVVPARTRRIYWGQDAVDAKVLSRTDLSLEDVVDGPVVVEQDDTTTVVPPGFRVTVDRWGNLIGEAVR